MTGKLSKNFHGVGIGPLSNILAVKVVVEELTRNCHKMATYYFVKKKIDRGIFEFCVITFEPYQLRFRPQNDGLHLSL